MSVVDQNKERKRKQQILGGTIGGLVLLVGIGSMFLLDDEGEVEGSDESQAQVVDMQDAGGIDNQDSWRRTMAEEEQVKEMKVEELERLVLEQQNMNGNLMGELEAMKQALGSVQNSPPQIIEKVTRVEVPVASSGGSYGGYNPSNQGQYSPPKAGSVLPNPNSGISSGLGGGNSVANAIADYANQNNGGGDNGMTTVKADPRKVEVISFDIPQKTKKSPNSAELGYKKQNKSLIPSTSFVAGTLLNGVDAPTGGQAQSNPLPIVLHVNNLANLPNNYKADVKNCRFLGAAWGELSSERMMARIESLSCIINGKSYEMPAKGYIIGEDGKAGMRGTLVSKKGKTLGLSFLAATVSATGSAIQQAAGSTTSFGGLSTNTVSGSDIAKAGIGGGIGGGADALSEYYVKQAEMLFDVIEINAGRKPEVLITSTIEFPEEILLKDKSRSRAGRGANSRILSDD